MSRPGAAAESAAAPDAVDEAHSGIDDESDADEEDELQAADDAQRPQGLVARGAEDDQR